MTNELKHIKDNIQKYGAVALSNIVIKYDLQQANPRFNCIAETGEAPLMPLSHFRQEVKRAITRMYF